MCNHRAGYLERASERSKRAYGVGRNKRADALELR